MSLEFILCKRISCKGFKYVSPEELAIANCIYIQRTKVCVPSIQCVHCLEVPHVITYSNLATCSIIAKSRVHGSYRIWDYAIWKFNKYCTHGHLCS